MDGHIIHSRDRIHPFHEFRIVLASHQPFISRRKKMVGVQLLDYACGLGHPAYESVTDQRVVREAAGLVADLPREYGWIVLIGLSGYRVRTPDYRAHVIIKEVLGRFGGLELPHLLHEGPVTVYQRDKGLFAGSPFEILAVSA